MYRILLSGWALNGIRIPETVKVHQAKQPAMTSTQLGSHGPPTPAPEIKAQLLREEALEALAKAHVGQDLCLCDLYLLFFIPH